jgi:hypothetical protein
MEFVINFIDKLLTLQIIEENEMSENVTRIQFDLPDTKIEELDKLMREGGIKTRRELFNNALSLLEWAIKQREDMRIIAAIDEESGSYRELSMPILDSVKPALAERSHAKA